MPPWLLALRASFTFLTRIPVGGFPYPQDTWKWISLWFPFVGLVLGGLASLLFLVLPDALSFANRAIIIVGLGMMLTGGFHEDGLADTADALGGAYNKERVMEILKDSRIGAFGGMALFVALALRIGLLADLGAQMMWGLILGQSLSRAASTMQLAIFPYAPKTYGTSKSKDVAVSGRTQFIVAFIWTLLILLVSWRMGLSISTAAGIIGVMAILIFFLGWRFMKRAGGLTGDFLGTTQQLTELGILFVLVCI
ncbi:MAG: adenosylcobinamide-GDP ribazoletransferase [Myxococcota bacterium]|nr:adenosylcobinamide-GDP ribazoletransferase [Myxococcota bacterium]